MDKIFEKAARVKLRFQSNKGMLTVEDLWDLPLSSTTGKVNLDSLAVAAFNETEQQPTVSFVQQTAKRNTTADLQLEILKRVIEVRQAENSERLAATAKSEEKQKLLELLKNKQEQKLGDLSEEDLIARINAL